MAKEIMTEEFNAFINQDKPVLIDFWATWCGPCRMLAPVVEEVSAQYEGQVAVGKVDVDKCPELAKQFRVMSIPTLILFKDGKIVDQKLGFMPKSALEEMIRKAL
ncbi:MAG: thioredoxin [Clostridiales bacterium]|nr:thioredoxin [Clostridiales bacterium]